MSDASSIKPLRPIRRFDVFAETKRLEAVAHGEPNDVAKGYGIRIAKIVASRRFGGVPKTTHHEKKPEAEREGEAPTSRFAGEGGSKFRALDGVLQTDETFDHDVIDRMGSAFYAQVFSPAIKEALAEGRKYEQFRDTIRQDWKPARGPRQAGAVSGRGKERRAEDESD